MPREIGFEPLARRLSGPAGEAELSPIAARFLEALHEAPGATVGRRALIDRLWAGNHLVGDPALNRVASEVRRAAAAAGAAAYLETVHGRGYRLAATAAELPARRPISWAPALTLAGLVVVGLLLLSFVLILANGLVWGLKDAQ